MRGPRRLANGRARARRGRDLVAGLVLSAPHRVDRLYVGGEEVVRDGRLVTPTRRRSRGTIGARREDSPHDLSPTSSTRRAAGPPRAFASSSSAARSSSRRRRPTPTAGSRDLADARAGRLPARLPPAVAVLPPRRARARARRRALPRPAARLALRVRDLPRQLSVDELAELFRAARASSSGSPSARPARRARATLDRASCQRRTRSVEALDAHPRSAETSPSARPRAGRRRDAACSPSSRT